MLLVSNVPARVLAGTLESPWSRLVARGNGRGLRAGF